jgi:hypothetical protein
LLKQLFTHHWFVDDTHGSLFHGMPGKTIVTGAGQQQYGYGVTHLSQAKENCKAVQIR